MKKQRKTKAKNQTYHFKKRCDERLGVQIDRKAIQRRIQSQKYDEGFYMLDRQSNRVTRYRYKFHDKWYIIPYDKNTHKVITIFEDRRQDTISQTQIEEIAPQSLKWNLVNCLNKLLNIVKSLIKF